MCQNSAFDIVRSFVNRPVVGPLAIVVLLAAACGGKSPADSVPNLPNGQRFADAVVNGAFVVEPRTFKPFKVVVAPGMANARLEGNFTATGARNDIEVTLLTESEFANWQSRRTFLPVYVSGRVTAGKIAVDSALAPGTYFVVFSNRFSLLSNKAVVADVQLRYDRQ